MNPSTPLKGLPLAVLDTETTDLVPGHIVEVAVVHLTLGTDEPPRLAYSSRVRPHNPGDHEDPWPRIDEKGKAYQTNKISNADVADAPTWGAVWPHVAAALDGRVVVSHNASTSRFDRSNLSTILRAEPRPRRRDDAEPLALGSDEPEVERGGRVRRVPAAHRGSR